MPRAAGAARRRWLFRGLSDIVTAGRVLYGGSAGPGLLTEIGADVDGLFLGRFAHDPTAVKTVVAEAAAITSIEPNSR